MQNEAKPAKALSRVSAKSAEHDGASFSSENQLQSLISLRVDEIEPYDKNPRRLAHPEFNLLKQSITADGILHPLIVTRKSEKSKYMIFKGGNARLRAIRELYEETADEKYEHVICTLLPWTGLESDAIVGHLQENELRGSLCFLDRAYGISAAIQQIKLETDDKNLSLRKIALLLRDKGYAITLSNLYFMIYASEKIDPHIDKSIAAYLGRPQIKKISRLENSFRKLCNEMHIPDAEQDKMFTESLQNYNEPTWSFNQFRSLLEATLAEQRSASIQDIYLRMESYLTLSTTPLSDKAEHLRVAPIALEHDQWPNNAEASTQNSTQKMGVYTVNTHFLQENSTQSTRGAKKMNEEHITKSSQSSSRYNACHQSPVIPELEGSIPHSIPEEVRKQLQSLRTSAYKLAWSLAKRHRLLKTDNQKLATIVNTGNWGIGFLVRDFPISITGLTAKQAGMRDALWWLLTELSDLQWAVSSSKATVVKIVGDSPLETYVKSSNAKTLHLLAKNRMKCVFPHLGVMTFSFRLWDDKSMQEFEQLMQIYRSIHALSRKNNFDLFQPPHNSR